MSGAASGWASRFAIPASHPCLPGHFPGRPVVPGVVLLDAVFVAMRAAGLAAPVRLIQAKFTAPVGPEEAVEVALRRTAPGRVAFSGSCRGVPALSGEVELGGVKP